MLPNLIIYAYIFLVTLKWDIVRVFFFTEYYDCLQQDLFIFDFFLIYRIHLVEVAI